MTKLQDRLRKFDTGIHTQAEALRVMDEAADLLDKVETILGHIAVLGHGKCTIGKPLAEMVRAALAKLEGVK